MKQRFAIGVLLLVTMPMVAVGVLYMTNSLAYKELPNYGKLPSFQFTERSGQALSDADLKRKVWIGSFIFTSCGGQCPLIVAELKKIQKALRFKDNFRLISFTLDPTRDTPNRLSEYAQGVAADPYKWLFLTGENIEIQKLVQSGFQLASVGAEKMDGDIVHSSMLVLMDGGGRIRGYYDSTDADRMKTLMKDAKGLIRGTY